MRSGVIYFNTNTRCIIRLLVSLYSLRQYEDTPVAIISEGEDSHIYCRQIAKAFDNVEVVESEFNIPEGKNESYLKKTLSCMRSPFDITVFLDADTLVCDKFVNVMVAKSYEKGLCVTHFSDWTTKKRTIKKRINAWEDVYPDKIKKALKYGKAINGGVFSYRKTHPLMQDWYELSLAGRDVFIPDETCMQVQLPFYEHNIVGNEFNFSCKYNDISKLKPRVIHYHGRKHCRLDEDDNFIFNADKWYNIYEEVMKKNIANIKEWGFLGDRTLRKCVKALGKGE